MPNTFSHNIKSLMADGLKALSRGIFANAGGTSGQATGYGGTNFWGSGTSSPGFFGRSAGSAIDWELVTGDIQSNPIASTCLAIIQDNFCMAHIRVEQKSEDEDKYERVPDHPLLPILTQPNPFYSWNYLTRGVLASMHGQGDAYIGIERDGNGLPARLYWLPYGVRPGKDKGSKSVVDFWIYKQGRGVGETETRIPVEDIIHIPMGTNPNAPGFGLAPALCLKQDQYTLERGANYTANVMRNNGTVGALLSPKQVKNADGQPVEVDVDPQSVVDLWRSKTRGDKTGEVMYFDFPVDVSYPNNTPQNLAIDTILDRPECNICAVFRVSILLVGAYAGRAAKTYNNLGEARTALWEECLLPLQSIIAAELTTQLLPQCGGDAINERVVYDTSGIRALQPDLDMLHERVRDDYQANLIDLYTAEVETKRVPDDAHKGVYFWMLPHVTDRSSTTGTHLRPGDVSIAAPDGKQPQLPAGPGKPLEMSADGVAGKSLDIGRRMREQIAEGWKS